MNYSSQEMMTVAAARALSNDDVCFVGIGLPSAACNLARLTHAPRINLIYESGTLQTRPDVLPLSIGDGELCETALTTVPVPEIFRYWLQGGRITVGFLGGAQVDRFGNLNSTVIGNYAPSQGAAAGQWGRHRNRHRLRPDLYRDEAGPAQFRPRNSTFSRRSATDAPAANGRRLAFAPRGPRCWSPISASCVPIRRPTK